MQRPSTIELRRHAFDILLSQGRTSLCALAAQIGCPKNVLRYAIESAIPFDAMFKKFVEKNVVFYEAVPINEVYGVDCLFYNEFKNMINVIGLGYIGLPTALMMASHGVEVIGTDYNKELVATLNAGKTTFKEDGLDELFAADG